MYLKYSPSKANIDTIFRVVNENLIIINGEEYEFDINSIVWPDIRNQTNGVILEAHREQDGLYVTIIRKYTDTCASWDTGTYTLVEPTPVVIEPTPPESPPPTEEEPPIETPPPEPILEDPIIPPEGGI